MALGAGTLGLMGLPFSISGAQKPDKKLGIALVGLGGYARGQLAPALQETQYCKLSGMVSGSRSKAEKWAEKYGVPTKNIYNYENFDQIKDS